MAVSSDEFLNSLQDNLVQPSIEGTLNVLKSCIKATCVKRVVLTSSCSAIRYHADIDHVSSLNDSHWSDPDYCKEHNVRVKQDIVMKSRKLYLHTN